MLILKRVNKEIQKIYAGVKLVKGKGYFYFAGGIADQFEEQGFYGGVMHINDLTLTQWLRILDEKVKALKKGEEGHR